MSHMWLRNGTVTCEPYLNNKFEHKMPKSLLKTGKILPLHDDWLEAGVKGECLCDKETGLVYYKPELSKSDDLPLVGFYFFNPSILDWEICLHIEEEYECSTWKFVIKSQRKSKNDMLQDYIREKQFEQGSTEDIMGLDDDGTLPTRYGWVEFNYNRKVKSHKYGYVGLFIRMFNEVDPSKFTDYELQSHWEAD